MGQAPRPLMLTLLCLTLAAAVPPIAATGPVTSGPVAPLDGAQTMYERGSAKAAAGDNAGAIITWTNLLAQLPEEDGSNTLRLQALRKLALAHDEAYGTDGDPRHLHQAITLFEQHAQANPQGDGALQIARVQIKLDAVRKTPESAADPLLLAPARPGQDMPSLLRPNLRGLGIGLLAGGSASAFGGVAFLVAGSGLRASAEEQVEALDDQNVPEDDPSRDRAAALVESETRKGKVLMGVGGALVGVGIVGIGIGSWAMVKSKKEGGKEIARFRIRPARRGVKLEGRF